MNLFQDKLTGDKYNTQEYWWREVDGRRYRVDLDSKVVRIFDHQEGKFIYGFEFSTEDNAGLFYDVTMEEVEQWDCGDYFCGQVKPTDDELGRDRADELWADRAEEFWGFIV